MAFDIFAFLGTILFLMLAGAFVVAWAVWGFYKRLPRSRKLLLLAVLIVGGALLFEVGIGDVMVALGVILAVRDALGTVI